MLKRALIAIAALAPAFAAAPASAYYEYSGMNPTEGMAAIETILIFVGIPVATFAAVWFLWSLPKWMREAKK